MPKDVRRLLIFLLIVGLPCGGYLAWRWLDDRAAEKMWAEYLTAARSRGVKLTSREFYLDPGLPRDENFGASPLWDRVFASGTDADTIVPELPQSGKPAGPNTNRNKTDLPELRGLMVEAKWLTADHAGLTDAEAVLAGLERYRPFFDELRSLRPRSRAWYPVQWSKGMSAEFPHLTPAFRLGAALVAKARAELELGRAEDALETLHDAFRLASSLDSAPAFIPTLVSTGIDRSVAHAMHDGMVRGVWTADHLAALQELLSSRNVLSRLKGALEGERAIFNGTIEPLAAQLVGRLYVSSVDTEALGLPEWAATGRARWWRANQQWANQAFDEEIAAFDLGAETWRYPPNRSFDVEQLEGPDRSRLQLAWLSLSPFKSTLESGVMVHAVVRMGAIACALERFKLAQGNYPDALPALQQDFLPQLPRDPKSGEPFHYQRQGKTYLLYSVGLNGGDDGGDGDVFTDGQKHALVRQPDWVWPAPE